MGLLRGDGGGSDLTFLFTDVEGSTRLWERHSGAMPEALRRHDAILRGIVEGQRGRVFKTIGDAVCAVFERPADAIAAAREAQLRLQRETWAETGPLRVRVALHAGPAESREGDYFGPTLNRLARILSTAHGGQILLSGAVRKLAAGVLPQGTELLDLGESRLKDLALPERLFQLVGPGLPAKFPRLRTAEVRPNNLPASLTPLLGRDAELATLRGLLLNDRIRLVTLTGPGGIGKTRLALQAAADLLETFDGGAYFVSLAAIRDPAWIAGEIAQALGLREAEGEPPLTSLKEHLRERRLLLVLDNFEQILAGAPIVAELLRASPGSKALVTSRGALGLTGENEIEVPPLALPAQGGSEAPEVLGGYAAVELFLQRARAVRPAFSLDSGNAGAVAEICRRLDGLPLAIELAAARVKLLTTREMLPRLAARLELLTGGARDLPARQRTLRDAIAWSYDLLPEEHRAVFAWLAVFAGGCTLEAARRVCLISEAETVEAMSGLSTASLIRIGQLGGGSRFSLLETIREFALERLRHSADAIPVFGRHTRYFLELAEGAEPQLTGPRQIACLSLLENEHENLRAALERALRDEPETALRLAGSLWRFWMIHAHLSEGRAWLERALASAEHLELAAPLRVKVLTGLGVLVRSQGDQAAAEGMLDEALTLARAHGDRPATALALTSLGVVAYNRADYARAEALQEEALGLRRQANERWGASVALTNLALVAQSRGDFERARRLYEESLAISREIGDGFNAAVCLNNLGNVMLLAGDDVRARELLERALELRRELGDRWGVAAALHALGLVALRTGDRAEARRQLEASLVLHHELGDKEGVAVSLEGLGALAGTEGDGETLARLFAAARALREAIGVPLPHAERAQHDRRIREAREAAGPGAFAAAWTQGAALSSEQATALALSWTEQSLLST